MDETSGPIFIDLTWKLPITSNRAYKYIFILYDYDYNATLSDPIKSRTGPK